MKKRKKYLKAEEDYEERMTSGSRKNVEGRVCEVEKEALEVMFEVDGRV